jgi:autotransporter-associated beta strand protein
MRAMAGALALSCASVSMGQSLVVWNGGSSGTPGWLSSANWTPNTSYAGFNGAAGAGNAGDVAVFNNTGGGSAYGTVGVAFDTGLGSLQVSTIHNGGTNNLVVASSATTSGLAGSDTTLVLSGSNSALAGLSANTVLSTVTNNININASVNTLVASGLTTVSIPNAGSIISAGGTSSITFGNAVTVGGAGGIVKTGSGSLTFSTGSTLSFAGGLSASQGTVTVSDAQINLAGGVSATNGAAITLGGSAQTTTFTGGVTASGTGSSVTVNTKSQQFTGGVSVGSGATVTIGGGSAALFSGGVTVSANGTFVTTATNLGFSGGLSSTNGTVSFSSGTNANYTGNAQFSGGRVNISSAVAFGAAANSVTFTGGVLLDNPGGANATTGTNPVFLNQDTLTYVGSVPARTLQIGNAATANFSLGNASGAIREFNVQAGTFNITQPIVDGVNGTTMVKTGPGTLVLGGANINSGGLTLSSGSLGVTVSSVWNTSKVYVSGASGMGTFTINGGTLYNASGSVPTFSPATTLVRGDFTIGQTGSTNTMRLGSTFTFSGARTVYIARGSSFANVAGGTATGLDWNNAGNVPALVWQGTPDANNVAGSVTFAPEASVPSTSYVGMGFTATPTIPAVLNVRIAPQVVAIAGNAIFGLQSFYPNLTLDGVIALTRGGGGFNGQNSTPSVNQLNGSGTIVACNTTANTISGIWFAGTGTGTFSGQIGEGALATSLGFTGSVARTYVNLSGGGLQSLTGSNSYSYATVSGSGTLRVTLGAGLPDSAMVALTSATGGVLETSGTLSRGTTNGPGGLVITGGRTGFSASGGPLTVTLTNVSNVANGVINCGVDPGFSNSNVLVLNSSTATDNITFTNPLVFGGTANLYVMANTATMTGALTPAAGKGVGKNGPGTLVIATTVGTPNGFGATAGVVQYGNATAVGNQNGNQVTISSGATVRFAQPSDVVFGANLVSATVGAGTVVQAGPGTVSLGGTLFTGLFVVEPRQTLQIGYGTTSASTAAGSTMSLGAGSILSLASPGPSILATAVSGTGSVVSTGGITVTADNTYTGPTVINAGNLQIGQGGTNATTGSISASSPIIVNSATVGTVTTTGTLTFARNENITVANSISGGGNLTQNGFGTTILSGTVSLTGRISVSRGALVAQTPLRPVTGSLVVTGPASATLAASATTLSTSGYTRAGEFAGVTVTSSGAITVPVADRSASKASVIVTSGLNISFGGTIDLGNSDLVIRGGASNLANIRSWLTSGVLYASASIPSTPQYLQNTTLALFVNDSGDGVNPYFTQYDGVTNLAVGDVIVKYTYAGDTNLDGVLDGRDFRNVLEGALFGGTNWQLGDVDNSGAVSDTDVQTFMTAYNWYSSLSSPVVLGSGQDAGSATTSIPEPAMFAPLAGMVAVSRRRRR